MGSITRRCRVRFNSEPGHCFGGKSACSESSHLRRGTYIRRHDRKCRGSTRSPTHDNLPALRHVRDSPRTVRTPGGVSKALGNPTKSTGCPNKGHGRRHITQSRCSSKLTLRRRVLGAIKPRQVELSTSNPNGYQQLVGMHFPTNPLALEASATKSGIRTANHSRTVAGPGLATAESSSASSGPAGRPGECGPWGWSIRGILCPFGAPSSGSDVSAHGVCGRVQPDCRPPWRLRALRPPYGRGPAREPGCRSRETGIDCPGRKGACEDQRSDGIGRRPVLLRTADRSGPGSSCFPLRRADARCQDRERTGR